MKRIVLLAAMALLPVFVQAGDYSITMDRKKDGAGQMKGDIEKQTSQNWVGEINIENRTFKPSPELKLAYIVFVKRQELGQKEGADQVDQIRGDIKVGVLQGREKASFNTSEVTLKQQELDGGYYYRNGGRRKASDSVMGVWVKLFDGTKEVAEYANPSTIKAKNKWE